MGWRERLGEGMVVEQRVVVLVCRCRRNDGCRSRSREVFGVRLAFQERECRGSVDRWRRMAHKARGKEGVGQ